MSEQVNIEIWSDIICPFCYIGKRRFEAAISQLTNDYLFNITWKSFQLAPDMETNLEISIDEYLAKHKGFPLEKAKEMNAYVTEMAKNEGLEFNFNNAIVANTFLAHRFLHYALSKNKQYEAKELLFKAYFSEGKNIDNISTLIEIANKLALNIDEVVETLNSSAYSNEVDKDIFEAQQIGVRGVPFFVVNRTHAISGAQSIEVFMETIKQSVEHKNNSLPKTDGATCEVNGNC
jgi:predicted DsbA family dithiol-disulfide isomerase